MKNKKKSPSKGNEDLPIHPRTDIDVPRWLRAFRDVNDTLEELAVEVERFHRSLERFGVKLSMPKKIVGGVLGGSAIVGLNPMVQHLVVNAVTTAQQLLAAAGH